MFLVLSHFHFHASLYSSPFPSPQTVLRIVSRLVLNLKIALSLARCERTDSCFLEDTYLFYSTRNRLLERLMRSVGLLWGEGVVGGLDAGGGSGCVPDVPVLFAFTRGTVGGL